MRAAVPAMTTLSELVHSAVETAAHHVTEGSRRNALRAIEDRSVTRQQDADILASLPRQATRPTARRSPSALHDRRRTEVS